MDLKGIRLRISVQWKRSYREGIAAGNDSGPQSAADFPQILMQLHLFTTAYCNFLFFLVPVSVGVPPINAEVPQGRRPEILPSPPYIGRFPMARSFSPFTLGMKTVTVFEFAVKVIHLPALLYQSKIVRVFNQIPPITPQRLAAVPSPRTGRFPQPVPT